MPSTTSQPLTDRKSPPWLRGVPKTKWTAVCHPKVAETIQEVDGFYLQHWPFENEKDRRKFIAADFTSAVCWNYPEALDSRIGLACRLITLLFLIDDLLEYKSLRDGKVYNDKLMPLMRGEVQPDRSVPVEWITYDLWEEMRNCDADLTAPLLEPTFMFMRAQTDQIRLWKLSLGQYFEYRNRDVGADLVTVLGRFAMGLKIPEGDLALTTQLDRNYSKHLSVINDIWSYDKEVRASTEAHREGGALCNSVAILASEAEISGFSAKRTLYCLCREWEHTHEQLVEKMLAQKDTPALRLNARGMQYQMSGNELWSTMTGRYQNENETDNWERLIDI